jgi:hypothetical protein
MRFEAARANEDRTTHGATTNQVPPPTPEPVCISLHVNEGTSIFAAAANASSAAWQAFTVGETKGTDVNDIRTTHSTQGRRAQRRLEVFM